jgi:hypothetical protein
MNCARLQIILPILVLAIAGFTSRGLWAQSREVQKSTDSGSNVAPAGRATSSEEAGRQSQSARASNWTAGKGSVVSGNRTGSTWRAGTIAGSTPRGGSRMAENSDSVAAEAPSSGESTRTSLNPVPTSGRGGSVPGASQPRSTFSSARPPINKAKPGASASSSGIGHRTAGSARAQGSGSYRSFGTSRGTGHGKPAQRRFNSARTGAFGSHSADTFSGRRSHSLDEKDTDPSARRGGSRGVPRTPGTQRQSPFGPR